MLTAIKELAKTTALAIVGINDFSFENLEEAITQRTINYPLLHVNTFRISTIQDYTKQYYDCLFEFFIFELDKQYNADELVAEWDKFEAFGNTFIKNFIANNLILEMIDRKVTITRGSYQHQDELIGVEFAFNIRVYECHL